MGEFGAEVIKVEHPDGGDPQRQFGTPTDEPDLSLAWLSEARNKRSVTLDLKSKNGARDFKELVRRSDVVCENFRPGTLERWGLGWHVLSVLNPALVMLRISGYGQDGPYRDRPGFARIAHAVGGLTHLAGMPDGPPVTPGSTSLADYISGLYGAVAVEHEGCGGLQHVEVARDIGPVGQVDIQVTHPGARLRDLGERPVDRWAPAAHLGTELQQGGSVAESVGSEAGGLNDLVVDVAPQASLTGAQQDADHDGDRNKRGDAQQGGDGFHGNPH